jgi:hypothetical protein
MLKMPNNSIGPEGGSVHGGVKGGLKMFVVVAKGIEKKDDLDLIEIDWTHVGDPRVHCEDLVGAVTEGGITAIAEIKSLLE